MTWYWLWIKLKSTNLKIIRPGNSYNTKKKILTQVIPVINLSIRVNNNLVPGGKDQNKYKYLVKQYHN